MNRLALCGLAGCLLFSISCRRGPEQIAQRNTNLLLITLDTTRADYLSCYSLRGARTPHLDALAVRGVRFAHATVQAPLTLPSHASIMTGAYPGVHGVHDMEGFVLNASHPTLASITRANGFTTAAFVGSRAVAAPLGLANGFTTYDDNMGGAAAPGDPAAGIAERRAELVTAGALRWLEANRQQRFFLWVHYYDPHEPYNPPPAYRQAYPRDLYAGEIAYMDEQAGRLLDGVSRMGLDSRTLIAAIGDHGESLGEHGEATHGVFLYDSTLHVPFLLAGPDVPAGKVIDRQVRSIDVMPTLLTSAGLSPGGEAQGVSLWPLIRNASPVASGDSYAETFYPRNYMRWSELFALRTDTWKLIVAPKPEFYNLEKDPGERHNVIAEFPKEVERFERAVARERYRTHNTSASATDSRTRRELESLGYLSAGTPARVQLGPVPDPKERVAVLDLLGRTEEALAARHYTNGARLMEQALRLDPTNPRCHLYLATAYEQTGQYPRAVQVLEHALDAQVETDRIYARLGVDHLHMGHFAEAVKAMERARQINPLDLNNQVNLAMAYLQLGRPDDAERTFRAILARDASSAAAHDGLGLLAIGRHDLETARREFEKAVEANADDPKPLLDLGILYQQTGNRERSLYYLKQFLSKVPPGQFTDQVPAVQAAVREMSGSNQP